MRVSEILRHKGADVIDDQSRRPPSKSSSPCSANTISAPSWSPTTVPPSAGLVSERDVIRKLAGRHCRAEPTGLGDHVEHRAHLRRHDSVESLMGVMTERRVRHLPVVADDQQLRGIVSIGDVVKSTITQLEFERDQLQGYVTS